MVEGMIGVLDRMGPKFPGGSHDAGPTGAGTKPRRWRKVVEEVSSTGDLRRSLCGKSDQGESKLSIALESCKCNSSSSVLPSDVMALVKTVRAEVAESLARGRRVAWG